MNWSWLNGFTDTDGFATVPGKLVPVSAPIVRLAQGSPIVTDNPARIVSTPSRSNRLTTLARKRGW